MGHFQLNMAAVKSRKVHSRPTHQLGEFAGTCVIKQPAVGINYRIGRSWIMTEWKVSV